MSSLSPKDRVSLCSFTFSDGRRCRSPRSSSHPHFCFDHAQKEARARAAKKLSKDLTYFFSGGYLSACDLSSALARLIPAVLRGDVKPRTARTVAYLAQTLMQAIHLSKHEYINAFGTDAWRQSVRNSVNYNHDYRSPSGPQPEQSESHQPQPQPAATPAGCLSERSEEPAFPHSAAPSPTSSPAQPQTQTPQPAPATQPAPAEQSAPSPHTSLPPTSAEFVRQVVARLQTGEAQTPHPAPAPVSSPTSVSAPPPSPPQPAPEPHPFTSEALPPHVRRRLHRTTTPEHPSPPSNTCSLSPASPQPAPNRGSLRASLRPQLPSPHRRQTRLESTLTQRPQVLILNHLQPH